MKKLTVVLIIVLICASVFAGQRVELGLRPYVMGHIIDAETEEKVNSKYGLGGTVSMLYTFENPSWCIGGEISADNFFFDDSTTCFDLNVTGKIGLDLVLGEFDTAFFYGKVGVTNRFWQNDSELRPNVGAQVGIARALNKGTDLLFSCEARFNFPTLIVDAMVGVKHEL